MKQLELVIHNKTGLHARPARVFVDMAKRFTSEISVTRGAKRINAKSMIAVLSLGVTHGETICVNVTGADEDLAAQALAEAVAGGLGESVDAAHPPAATVAAPAKPAVALAAPAAPAQDGVYSGRPGAPGIAIGPIFRLRQAALTVREQVVGLTEEYESLANALRQAQAQLETLEAQVARQAGAEEAAIFGAHSAILSDPELLGMVHAQIAEGQSAAVAWQRATNDYADALAQLTDPLLAERAGDVRDAGGRVLRLLSGAEDQATLPDHPVIVVADELTPSETVAFDARRVLGFCTANGGPTSHAAILARALGIPAVMGAGAALLELADGTQAILDGAAGTLTLATDAAQLATAQAAQQALADRRAAAQADAMAPAITRDGTRVEVAANIGGLKDARQAVAAGAEGVGLLRTEFLFLDRDAPPGEDEQFALYRDIVQALEGRPLILRTLDIGGDKPLSYLNLSAEANPFLGERGIRLCLARPALLRTQLRAVLRAAAFGPLRVMFPMVSDIGELRSARAILDELRAELGAPPVEIGIMIEVPAAALMADVFAREVDFFSIGTNDLTQYTMAIDRSHPALAGLADGLHPSVLRLIAQTAKAAHAAGKWVGVCGELGSDPQAVPILIGLGVDELSVTGPAIAMVKAQVRGLNLAEARACAERALMCATAAEVRHQVQL